MSRTIIIPLSDPHQDQEGIAEQAIFCSRLLADTENTHVCLVSAIDDDAAASTRQAYLDLIAGTIGDEVGTVVEYGDPADVILDLAAETEHPVIVMASHGRRGVELRVLGSVACAVARGARCPVLILPASSMTQTRICRRIERVLLPISDPSLADAFVDATVAEIGAERAKEIEFRLVEVTAPIPPQPVMIAGDRYQNAHEVPTHFLRRVAERVRKCGYRATWDLRIGDPSRELTRIAVEDDVDLIVMPASSRNGFNRLVPAIISEQIRASRPVPVLLIHPEQTSSVVDRQE